MNPIRKTAIPRTIGELKAFIQDYPDNTPFGFINQPVQEIIETRYDSVTFVSFAEIEHHTSKL